MNKKDTIKRLQEYRYPCPTFPQEESYNNGLDQAITLVSTLPDKPEELEELRGKIIRSIDSQWSLSYTGYLNYPEILHVINKCFASFIEGRGGSGGIQ